MTIQISCLLCGAQLAGAPVGRGAVGADQVRAGRDEGRARVRAADLAAAAAAQGGLDARQRVRQGQPGRLSGVHCEHRRLLSHRDQVLG